MRTLVHLSDVHFGRIDEAAVEAVIGAVQELAPDLVVVSGDLTQRARRRQFARARAFLARLPRPQLVVPGNHDVPLYDVLRRFFAPLANYRRYISTDLDPFYADEQLAVLGVNTARSLTFKSGRVSVEQIRRLEERLRPLGDEVFKVVVTHHPLDLPSDEPGLKVVGRAERTIAALARCRVDLLLAGHYHVSHASTTAATYPAAGFAALCVHAGTATSTRGRGELNAFNVIRIERPLVTIERLGYRTEIGSFRLSRRECFEQTGRGWVRAEARGARGEASDG